MTGLNRNDIEGETITGAFGLTLSCQISSTGENAVATKTANRPTRQQLRAKLERNNYRCTLCGEPLNPQNAWLDHIDPRASGGTDGIENLQIVMAPINRAKGTLTQSQFISMCHAVARHCDDPGDGSWKNEIA
jgi:hypothetical protein